MSGGEGTIMGTIIGAFIISVLTNGLRILSTAGMADGGYRCYCHRGCIYGYFTPEEKVKQSIIPKIGVYDIKIFRRELL